MLDANGAYLRLFGYSEVEELRGRSLLEQIAPSHRADIRQRIEQRALGVPQPHTYEVRGLRKDGSEFPFEISTTRVVLADGPLTIAALVDLSERERATRALTEALALNQLVLGASTMGCLVYLVEGPCLFANEAVARLIGGTLPQMLAQNFREIASWKASGLYQAALAAIEHGTAQRGRAYLVSTFGAEVWVDYQLSTASSGGRPVLLAFLRDTTAEHRAQSALEASEERLRLALAAVNDAVWDWDLAEGSTFASPQARALLGLPEGAEPPSWPAWSAQAAPDDRAAHLAVSTEYLAGARTEHQLEFRVRTADGDRWRLCRGRLVARDAQGRPRRVVGTLSDIDARKRAEDAQRLLDERVRRTQQLESLGVLAGGVAHDFNNILTVIMGSTALAQREVGGETKVAAQLDGIAVAAQRAAELCRQMLAYAGQAKVVVQPFDLNALIGEMVAMLEVSVPKKASLVRALDPALPPVVGDPTQVRQVLMNLVLNAAEAITGPRGAIRVSTSQAQCDGATFARAVLGAERPPGDYARLEVEDDGAGMDAQTVAKMFDPFFTTKFAGRGLGMAAVLGIVRGHRGAIEVDSQPGRGTRICVYLPVRKGEAVAPKAPAPAEFRGQGLVLLVDDEPQVRKTSERLLKALGFEVVTACDGEEALSVYRAHQGRVALVLMDLTMPRMNGAEALVALRRLDPRVRVVLVSGYGAAQLTEGLGAEQPDAVLEKPYRLERLVEVLRSVTSR